MMYAIRYDMELGCITMAFELIGDHLAWAVDVIKLVIKPTEKSIDACIHQLVAIQVDC